MFGGWPPQKIAIPSMKPSAWWRSASPGAQSVLGFDGLWVDDGVGTDLGYIVDFSPNGLRDLDAIAAALRTWPREDGFCVEIVFGTPLIRPDSGRVGRA